MRAEGGSPNLINGVSRQPPEVRLTSQLDESVNQFPTVTRGLVPRNPAVLKNVLVGAQPANSTVHLIDRDASEQYIVTVSPSGVQVHALEGGPRTVSAPNGYGYLAGALAGDLEVMTVSDYTFILNKRRTVAASTAQTAKTEASALIHIVNGDYHTPFKIYINGSLAASYTTDGGPYEQEEDARKAEKGARPANIAHQLCYGTPLEGPTLPAAATSNLQATLGTSDWAFTVVDNVIYVRNTKGVDFTVQADAGSETRMRAHKGLSPEFSELPRKAVNGFILRISGSADTDYDDYYVRFDRPTMSAQGRWKETIGPEVPTSLDAATMPHILVRNADGTFTFKQASWKDRDVGDLTTNPWPSFVGRTISEIVFYKNRIGFASAESLAMSRADDHFNFFIESILTQLDTDPIDVSIPYTEISNITYAVPFSGELMTFSSSVPFRLAGGEILTPSNANFEHVLSNETSSRVRPVVAGSRLYFVNDSGSGCFVHEFLYDREVGVKDAPTITDHVNGYIPSGVVMMEADEDLKVLALVSEKEPNTVYTYKWLWIGNEKAQSAWQKWVLPHPITGMKFFGEELVLVSAAPERREVLSINCHEAWTGPTTFPIFLDRRAEVHGVYDAISDKTTFTLSVSSAGASLVFRDEEDFGLQPDVMTYSGNTIVVPGNQAKWAYVGWEYESYGILSPVLYRKTNNQGGYANAEPGVITTVNTVAFGNNQTAYLTVELSRVYRQPYTYNYSAALVGTKTGVVGSIILGEINKAISVMARSDDFKIKFGNRGPYPYAIMSYRWTGRVVPISY